MLWAVLLDHCYFQLCVSVYKKFFSPVALAFCRHLIAVTWSGPCLADRVTAVAWDRSYDSARIILYRLGEFDWLFEVSSSCSVERYRRLLLKVLLLLLRRLLKFCWRTLLSWCRRVTVQQSFATSTFSWTCRRCRSTYIYVDTDVRLRRWWGPEPLSTSWAREPLRCRRDVKPTCDKSCLHAAYVDCLSMLLCSDSFLVATVSFTFRLIVTFGTKPITLFTVYNN